VPALLAHIFHQTIIFKLLSQSGRGNLK